MMNTQNDSVIICDSPSPARLSTENVPNYRKRLRSSTNFKDLLDTVYESPLVHLRRNILSRLRSEANVKDSATLASPSVSKRCRVNAKRVEKIPSNLDQSIVIINDTIAESVVEIGMSDAETTDIVDRSKLKRKSPAVLKSGSKTPRLKGQMASLRGKRILDFKNSVNDENHDGQIMKDNINVTGEAEDIEVVWVSGPNTESTSKSRENHATEEEPFVIDKEPNPAYLTVKSAFRKKDVKRPMTKRQKGRFEKKLCNPRTLDADRGTFHHSNEQDDSRCNRLREIVIDGSNVAMGHKNGKGFSEKGLQIVIDYFKERGHVVRVFLPQSTRTRDRGLIEKLHSLGYVIFTPSRKIGGREITPYDDRFILEYATKCNGIVVSSDQFRDMWREKPEWRDTIENRLLAPTFVGDYLMFPEDPLGRDGPKLEEFLRY